MELDTNTDYQGEDLKQILPGVVSRCPGISRACLALVRYDEDVKIADYINVGDTQIYHFTKHLHKMKKYEKEHGKNKYFLHDISGIEQSRFNFVNPSFLGVNAEDIRSSSSYNYNKIKHLDIIVIVNRGVSDALTSSEIATILEGFLNVERSGKTLVPDIAADIIVKKALNKTLAFSKDRPIVRLLQSLDANPSKIIADDCMCHIDVLHRIGDAQKEEEEDDDEKDGYFSL